MDYVFENGNYIPRDYNRKYPPGTVFHWMETIPKTVDIKISVVSPYLSEPVVIPVKIGEKESYRTGTWVPWTYEDLKDMEQVSFVPQPVPSLLNPYKDIDGHQMILMDVNDLQQWLTVGVMNTVPKMFYDAYKNCYDVWREAERFKYYGPEITPWSEIGPDGRKAWQYEPYALSFGIDIDGRYLYAGCEYEEIEPGFLQYKGKSSIPTIKVTKRPARDAKGRFVKRSN